MLRIQSDPVARRTLLQAGGAGLLGLGLPKVLRASEQPQVIAPRAKAVIFLFLFGGPSQLETFDMKPDAPDQIRGPFQPITCRTPELRICEHLPRIAEITDRLTVVRTMSHSFNDHSGGGHYVQTGQRWHIPIGGGFNATPKDWPSIGSVVDHLDQQRDPLAMPQLPRYVVAPNFLGRLEEYSSQLIRPGEYGGWLGRRYDPLTTRIEKKSPKDNPYYRPCDDAELDYQVQGLAGPQDVTVTRLENRASLLDQFDESVRALDANRTMQSFDRFRERAMSLVTSARTREALDIRRESPELRDRYGRHLFGQSTLLARRLIEAGARFATVHFDPLDGYGWDSHLHSNDVRDHLLPSFDSALSSLIVDLEDRGMLDETLVVAMGEMGRTPKANKNWGRDHWSTLFPAVLAGGGMKRGYVYGETDASAAYATTPVVSPEDLAATIYHAMGIDPDTRIVDAQNRPVSVCPGGTVRSELFV
jgi:hypothetical protein